MHTEVNLMAPFNPDAFYWRQKKVPIYAVHHQSAASISIMLLYTLS